MRPLIAIERRGAAAPIKVLSDLSLLFLLRVYRHSGPIGPGVHPVHPANPDNPASDAETQQHREKVWKTLMSIERRRNKQKRSVRTLIAIDTDGPVADCFWRRGAIILFILRILAILLQTTKTRTGPIKVLSDLSLLFLLISIDIKVFQTFGQSSRAAPILRILAILHILLQTTERWRGTGPRATAATPNSTPGPRGL